MSQEKEKQAPIPPEPPKISPEEWRRGIELFSQFLKKIEIRREGRAVHVDWIFEFPDEDMARIFVKTASVQLGGAEEARQ